MRVKYEPKWKAAKYLVYSISGKSKKERTVLEESATGVVFCQAPYARSFAWRFVVSFGI